MERLIEVNLHGRYIFSVSEIVDAFQLDEDVSAIELLEYAEELINNLPSETVLGQAIVESSFLYDYEEAGA